MLLACFLVPPKGRQQYFRTIEAASLNRPVFLQNRAFWNWRTTSEIDGGAPKGMEALRVAAERKIVKIRKVSLIGLR